MLLFILREPQSTTGNFLDFVGEGADAIEDGAVLVCGLSGSTFSTLQPLEAVLPHCDDSTSAVPELTVHAPGDHRCAVEYSVLARDS